jgi:hypothetical protein
MDDINGSFIPERIYQLMAYGGRPSMSAIPFTVGDAIHELRESVVSAANADDGPTYISKYDNERFHGRRSKGTTMFICIHEIVRNANDMIFNCTCH